MVTCEERREELETFHQTLHDISYGIASENVQQFIVDAYVRGAKMTATTVGFEGSTAVFTKRRPRMLLLLMNLDYVEIPHVSRGTETRGTGKS